MRCLLLANCIIQNPKIQNALREKNGFTCFPMPVQSRIWHYHSIAEDSSTHKGRGCRCVPVTTPQPTDRLKAVLKSQIWTRIYNCIKNTYYDIGNKDFSHCVLFALIVFLHQGAMLGEEQGEEFQAVPWFERSCRQWPTRSQCFQSDFPKKRQSGKLSGQSNASITRQTCRQKLSPNRYWL